MGDFTFTAPDGNKYTVKGPAGATHEEAFAHLQEQLKTKQPADPWYSRLGTGGADPFYGAAQFGARMHDLGEESIPAPELEQLRKGRIEAVDKQVREREEKYHAPEGVDWMRGIGSIPGTMALTSPLMVFGGVPGAVALGAGGGAVQPAKDFEKEKLGQVGVGAAIGGGFGLAGKAVSALGQWFAREFPHNVMTQAVQRILRRAGQDERAGGLSVAAILDLVNAARREGKPMALADPAGRNVRGLAGRVTREPGEAQEFAHGVLNTRQAGASGRLRDDLARFVHSEEGVLQTTEALQTARAAAAAEPYARALDPTRIVDSEQLQRMLADPLMRTGIREGLESQRIEALIAGREMAPNAAQALVLDEAGNVTGLRGVPNMGIIDAAKKGLDRLIERERNDVTGRLSQRGTQLDQLRRAYLAEVDRINPDYRAARAIWSGYSGSLDALRAGRSALQNTPEEIAAEFRLLAPGDQEFYRLGIADKLRERLMKAGLTGNEAQSRNQANAVLNSDWMREQLRPLFRSPQDFDGFMRAVNAEHLMVATRNDLIRGSQTAGRVAEDTAGQSLIEQHGAGVAHDVMNRAWGNLLMRTVGVWRDRIRDRELIANQAVNNQVARILFGPPDPEVARALLRGMSGPRVRLENPMQVPADILQRLAPGGGSPLAR